MSNIVKLVVPLIDSTLSLSDISEEEGFVNAYLKDINRPQLDHHLFLLYKPNFNSISFVRRDYRFRTNPRYYSSKVITINNVQYLLYIFTLYENKFLQMFDKLGLILETKDYVPIYKFWNFSDEFVNRHMSRNVSGQEERELFENIDSVPEQDYVPTLEDAYIIRENSCSAQVCA